MCEGLLTDSLLKKEREKVRSGIWGVLVPFLACASLPQVLAALSSLEQSEERVTRPQPPRKAGHRQAPKAAVAPAALSSKRHAIRPRSDRAIGQRSEDLKPDPQ